MNTIRLNVDRTAYTTKDAAKQRIGSIKNRVGAGSTEIEPKELIALVENGGSFAPALMNGTEAKNWQSQQVIIADIDNDEPERDENGELIKDENGKNRKVPVKFQLSSVYAAEICKAHGITPFFMYHTLSNGKVVDGVSMEKYRIVVILDTPITDAAEANNLTARFIDLFNKAAPGAADTSVKNLDRVLFGSCKGSAFNISETITPLEVMRALPEIRDDVNDAPPRQEPAKSETKGDALGWDDPIEETPRSRLYDEIDAQRRRDIESFDLEGYILKENPGARIHRVGNQRFINPCPICGHNDDFVISGHIFKLCCSGRTIEPGGGDGGSVIDYFVEKDKITLQEALQKFDDLMGYKKPQLKKTAQNIALEEKTEPATNETVTHEEAEETLNKYSATNYLAALNDTENQATQIKTGFSKFDEFMDGGLYPGLYILGAISSMGKTSFMVQLADQIAAAGNDVMFFTLEMGAKELIAKSVSRYTYLTDEENAVTANTLLMGKKRADLSTTKRVNLDTAIERYANEVGAHSWYFESTGDKGITEIEKSVKSFITITGRTPIIFIDYLQIMKPIEDSWTEKRNTDKNVLQLRKMARDYNTVVFAISSLNRGSYKGDIEMDAFKESGAIEYGSDVLMGLQPRGMNAGISQKEQRTNKETIDDIKQREIREIELKILKNRSGRTGKRIPLEYNTLFNVFTEPKEFDAWQRFDTSNNWQETDGIYF